MSLRSLRSVWPWSNSSTLLQMCTSVSKEDGWRNECVWKGGKKRMGRRRDERGGMVSYNDWKLVLLAFLVFLMTQMRSHNTQENLLAPHQQCEAPTLFLRRNPCSILRALSFLSSFPVPQTQPRVSALGSAPPSQYHLCGYSSRSDS